MTKPCSVLIFTCSCRYMVHRLLMSLLPKMILSETDPSLAWIFRMLPSQQKHFHGPHPVHNHFITGLLSAEATAAFHVMVTPDQKSFTVPNLQYTYGLPDFAVALTEYISKSSQGASTTSWTCWGGSVRMWNKFHIQLLSNFQSQVVMPSQIIQSYLPSEAFPFGNFDTVLIQLTESNGKTFTAVPSRCLLLQPLQTSTSYKYVVFSNLPPRKAILCVTILKLCLSYMFNTSRSKPCLLMSQVLGYIG